MKRLHFVTAVQAGAAVTAATVTLALSSAVVSLSEPHRSQLIAATASKKTASRKQELAVARSTLAPATLVAAVTPR